MNRLASLVMSIVLVIGLLPAGTGLHQAEARAGAQMETPAVDSQVEQSLSAAGDTLGLQAPEATSDEVEPTVKAAAEAALGYMAEKGFKAMALKDVFEMELPGALCYSVDEGTYQVFYNGCYCAFAVSGDDAVTVSVIEQDDRLPVYDTLDDAQAALNDASAGAPNAFLTRGHGAIGDRGHAYYAKVTTLESGQSGITADAFAYALASAESAVNPYQLGYTDDSENAVNSVNAAIDAFHDSNFHTLVFPQGDYRLVEDIDSQYDNRAYYGLDATLYTDGAVTRRARNSGHNSLWVIRGSVGWSKGESYTVTGDDGTTTTKKKDIYYHVSNIELNGLALERRTGTSGYNRMVSVRSARDVTFNHCTFDGITADDAMPASGDTTSTNGAIVDFYGDYDNVKFLDSTIVGEAAIDIRDLCDHVGNIPSSAQATDDYPTGGRNVVVRGNDITTYNFDEGLPIFAGNEQGLGTWKDGVFTEYATLTHCLVENVLVEGNTYTMLKPATDKQRVVAITCGYQDSPVRNVVIRDNTFDVCANSYLIMFGYAENCLFAGNEITLRRTTGESKLHELVHRSDHSRTGPTSGVTVGDNKIVIAGEDATVSRMVGTAFGPEAISFTGNDITVEGTVERVFDSTAVQEGNTFHLNYVKHLYDRVGEVANNVYDIEKLDTLYESYGTDAKADLNIHDEKASIGLYTSKYLLSFNGEPRYNGCSLTFANCIYDADALSESYPRIAWSSASIVDTLGLNLVGNDISWFASANNYAIQNNGDGKVALAVSGSVYGSSSVAALRANRALAAGDVVRTQAYYEGGVVNEASAGSGVYDIEVHADWQSSEDDGGSRVRLDNGLWAVLRVADRTVDVRQFGAKGDGAMDGTAATANANATAATDDANRLAAAMGYAAANPGTTVYFPEGSYCVSRGIEVPPQTTLTGAYATTDVEPAHAVVAEGKSATLGMYAGGVMRAKPQGQEANTKLLATITPLDPTSHATSLVSLGGSDDVAIDHLVIDAGRSMQAVVDALPNYSINNYDWTDPAMPYRGYFTALTFSGNKNVKVADCIVRNNVSMGCQFNGGENVSFERCDFLSVDVGIQEQGASPVKDVFIRDCYFEGHDWSEPVAFGPSYAGDATGIWIERNTMRGIKHGHAIAISERAQAYVDHTTFKDIHINGNTAYDMASLIGISVADGLEMRNNRGYDAGQSYLYSCKNVAIDGLEMHGSARHGLLVGQECENVSITGLVVENYDQDGGGAPGIDLSGTAANVSLSGRVASTIEHGGPGVNLSGSGYDISGLQFDLEPTNYFDVMVYEGGVGNTMHVGPEVVAQLGIAEDAYRVPRIYVAEAVARSNDFAFDYAWPTRDRGTTASPEAREQFSGMRATDGGAFETETTLPTGHGRYYKTIAIQAWDGAEDGTGNLAASYMEPTQDDFTRTLSLLTASDMHLANGDPSRSGAIVWAGERTLSASSEPYELVLVCRGGIWYEQGDGADVSEFPSLAALRNAAGLVAGQVVKTLAYREGSGKGGASYLVCDEATAANLVGREAASLSDDGGRLIELAGTPDMWAALVGVEADAYAFGAYGDGEHDDAAVLQALLDSGLENARLLDGVYLVGTPLVATKPLSVTGVGADASKVVASTALSAPAGAALLSVRDVEGFSVSDIGFTGWERSADADALDLLRIDGCARTQVSGCAFGPATGNGVAVAGSTRTAVSDCTISNVATGIHVGKAAAGADDVVSLMRNDIANVAVDGIAFAADGSTYEGKIAIYSNKVAGAPVGAGILLARVNCYNLLEIGTNVIDDCFVGIRVGGVTGTLDATDNNPRRITSNTVRNATYGIIFERSSGTALILNEVFDVQRTGLYLDTLSDCCTIWCWVTRYGLNVAGSADGLSDGCAIECVGEASNVTLGGWVNGNHRLPEYAATKGRTACRVNGSGWDLSGLTFFCTMQEEDDRPTVTFAAGAEGNIYRTQFDAIVLDASSDGKNVIDTASGSDARLVVWDDRAEAQRIQAVINPTDPRAGFLADKRAYASVAAMRADETIVAGDVATTAAYYENGTAGNASAGAGTYDIMAASDVTFANASEAVDGGRYIALDNGLVAVLRAEDETVDLYQYGARGDGATNDTARIQAAFDSGVATMHAGAGTYVCGGAVIPSGTSVAGVGRDVCAFVSPLGEGGYGVAGPLGIASGAHDVALKGVTVDGRRDVYGKTGVSKDADAPELAGDAAHYIYDSAGADNYTLFGWLGGAIDVTVEGCRFKSNNSEAVKFVGGKDISFANCEFLDVDCGIITQGAGEAANVTNLLVDGCVFDGHWFSEPISMFAEGSRYEGLTFTNNTFKNKPAGSAILLYADDGERKNTFHDVTISGNVMQRCSGGLALYAVDGATIRNNDLGGSHARLYGCKDATIDRIAFKDCPQLALMLRDCVNVRVTGLDVDGFGISSPAFPAISIGDATGGRNTGCSIAGAVKGSAASDGSWRSAVNATAGGVDLSGLTFAVGANTHALFVNGGVTGLTYHTSQDVSVYDGSGTLGNDIVVDHVVALSGGAALDNWNKTHNTGYTLDWTTYATESFTHMQACQDGFTRTLTVNAVNSDATLADGDGSQGSITWLGGGHTIAKGESATFTLVCQEGFWHEQEGDPEPPAHAHALERVAAVPATCLDPSAREHWRCTDCGKLFADADGTQETDAASLVVPATGHNWDEWRQTTAPTCTEAGTETRTCKNDPSHAETREVAALGHADDGGKVTHDATEDEEGLIVHTCTRCGETLSTEVIPRKQQGGNSGEDSSGNGNDSDSSKGSENEGGPNDSGSGGDSPGDGKGNKDEGGEDGFSSGGDNTGGNSSAYTIILNPNGTWNGAAAGYAFSSSADFSKFVCVLVDGGIIDPACYDAESGSTKVTLHADYLSTLASGVHTATIRSTDGEASTTFTIQEAQGNSSGKDSVDEVPDSSATEVSRNSSNLGALSDNTEEEPDDQSKSGDSSDGNDAENDEAENESRNGESDSATKNHARQHPSNDTDGHEQEAKASDVAANRIAGKSETTPRTGDSIAAPALALLAYATIGAVALAIGLARRRKGV